MSVICASCGQETPEGFPRCANCGAPLTALAATREERKVVTCVFCDLVGFTARAENMDPEDVRRLLQPYHARVRSELERFGGTVEKFIGDAVVAIFGAPVAHEDDPERAVRAALAIREALAGDAELEARIGITTGEALVSLDARPETGEGMASGDVVNTAARLQAAAAPGSILVDESTYRATDLSIEYATAGAVDAKGKTHPVAVWQPVAARLPVGAERTGATQLVGRRSEMEALRDEASKALLERELRVVSLVGVPGIGKSRLVRELDALVRDGSFGDVSWLRGVSPSYGEDASFSAFSDIVKAGAGIRESDSPQDAERKLSAAVATVLVDPSEADWVQRHLAPLLGLAGGADGDDRRPERFAAWRRYLEGLGSAKPLVLVFEDLHWADDGLLDFVSSIPEWMPELPILVIATARPDLVERRPGWGSGERMTVLSLEPLSDDETSDLIAQLLAISDLSAEARSTLLEQSGGNPLYAEQYVRMVAEGGAGDAVPQTVQALIVARLDALPDDEKRIAQNASVIGGVFWSGAVAATGGEDRWTVDEYLRALERKALVRRSPHTSVAGETEWIFGHALVRDAAYAAIPRAARGERHLRVAEWMESLGRRDEHAELVAHHYVSALDLASATGLDAPQLSARALVALRRAGDRAGALHSFAVAARFYRRALGLQPPADPERARLLLSLGRALWIAKGGGVEELLAASEALREGNDPEGAAQAEELLVDGYWGRGDRDKAATHLQIASALVDELEPSPAKAVALCFLARTRSRASEHAESARIAENALALAESLGLDEVRASALWILGAAKLELGEDESGFAELEESIRVARSIGSLEAIRANTTLAHQLRHRGQFTRSVVFFEEALRLSEQYGSTPQRRMLAGMLPQQRFRQGRWNEAVEAANAFLDEVHGVHYHTWHALQTRGLIRLSRGDETGIEDAEASIEAARSAVDASVLSSALGVYGRMLVLVGRTDEARQALDESLAIFDSLEGRSGFDLPYLVITAFELGENGSRVLTPMRHRRWAEAARWYFAREFGRAAEAYREIGTLTDEAEARFRSGLMLLEEGKRPEGAADMERALAFYRGVGAAYYVRRGEEAMADAGLEVPA
jgi:class 3 adenylate cyclase/tetratricopeptide (TPR) repeat protein